MNIQLFSCNECALHYHCLILFYFMSLPFHRVPVGRVEELQPPVHVNTYSCPPYTCTGPPEDKHPQTLTFAHLSSLQVEN